MNLRIKNSNLPFPIKIKKSPALAILLCEPFTLIMIFIPRSIKQLIYSDSIEYQESESIIIALLGLCQIFGIYIHRISLNIST